ncbi:hypothetical protein DXT89_24970 [Agrobacterium vitis]|uniref:Uncharacterized protein n=1 Tax=Agrobacterium vitis TaxID=373 RepID=A0A368NWG7_AGRVI|nr:hypothetical protein DXM22_23975 [Agrobacterium vitis]KAA3520724.1 hypothetical protein DXT89_24970 [Agrobacterium vitis]RCU54912.1 hypothetical protein ASB66_007915 [Agrobacterium vitis]
MPLCLDLSLGLGLGLGLGLSLGLARQSLGNQCSSPGIASSYRCIADGLRRCFAVIAGDNGFIISDITLLRLGRILLICCSRCHCGRG